MTLSNLPLEWLPLADAIVKATLILALAACASLALGRASAAVRHLVWTLALFAAVALPVLNVALPKWQLPLVRIANGAGVAGTAAEMNAEPAAPLPRLRHSRTATGASGTASPASPAEAPPQSFVVRVDAAIRSMSWLQALLAIWIAGTAVVLARLAIGLIAVGWLSRRTLEITNAPWLPLARSLAAHVGVSQRLRFLRSGRASMPVAAGILRPSVIMPTDADSWSESRLRIVLLHELAHVKRRDCLTHLVAQIACAFYWFNPLAWIAAKRARTERERACDDLVLASGTRSCEYADELLDIARCMRGQRLAGVMAGASLAMAHHSQLEGRLIAILDPKLPRAGVSRRRGLAAVALCCCAVAPLGALQPWTTEVDAHSPHAAIVTETQAPIAADDSSTAAPASTAKADTAAARQDRRDTAPRGSQGVQPPPPLAPPQPLAIPQPVVDAPAIVQAAVDGIAGGLEEAVRDAVTGGMQDPKPDPQPRKESGRQADPRMVAALTAALKDPDKDVRETAMQALVNMRDPAIFEPLVQALKDSSPDVREQAAAGLGRLRDRRAVEPLMGALKDQNAGVREQAVFALGQLRDRAAVPALMGALKDASASVREQAAFGLGQLRDPAAVEGLNLAVRDANAEVRQQAVFALSQIRDPRSVEPLISALKDTVADVRQQAAFALGQLRNRSAIEALIVAVKDPDADVRQQVVFALGQLRDPRAIDALTTALKDQSADVRQQAAFALGQLAR